MIGFLSVCQTGSDPFHVRGRDPGMERIDDPYVGIINVKGGKIKTGISKTSTLDEMVVEGDPCLPEELAFSWR
jgi:hypothetical protein